MAIKRRALRPYTSLKVVVPEQKGPKGKDTPHPSEVYLDSVGRTQGAS